MRKTAQNVGTILQNLVMLFIFGMISANSTTHLRPISHYAFFHGIMGDGMLTARAIVPGVTALSQARLMPTLFLRYCKKRSSSAFLDSCVPTPPNSEQMLKNLANSPTPPECGRRGRRWTGWLPRPPWHSTCSGRCARWWAKEAPRTTRGAPRRDVREHSTRDSAKPCSERYALYRGKNSVTQH